MKVQKPKALNSDFNIQWKLWSEKENKAIHQPETDAEDLKPT